MLLKLFIESELSEAPELSQRKLNALVKEWSFLAKQAAVLNALAKRISSRVAEIEETLHPIVKAEETKQLAVKHTLVEYTTRKQTKVKYKEVFEKALEVVNEEQKTFLQEYKEEMTDRGTVESLKLVDPELAQLVKNLNVMTGEELISMLPRLNESQINEVSFPSVIRKLVDFFKKKASVLTSKQKNSIIAVKQLEKSLAA